MGPPKNFRLIGVPSDWFAGMMTSAFRLRGVTSLFLSTTEQYTGRSSALGDIEFTEAIEESEGAVPLVEFTATSASRKRKRLSKGKQKVGTKKAKKGKHRKRETLFRTKVRRKLLKEYHGLIAKRKRINKAIKDNRRHRNQLVFHREPRATV